MPTGTLVAAINLMLYSDKLCHFADDKLSTSVCDVLLLHIVRSWSFCFATDEFLLWLLRSIAVVESF